MMFTDSEAHEILMEDENLGNTQKGLACEFLDAISILVPSAVFVASYDNEDDAVTIDIKHRDRMDETVFVVDPYTATYEMNASSAFSDSDVIIVRGHIAKWLDCLLDAS